jgi:phosphatidylglycerol:prolipoprotein diacylglycerol transferase
MHPVIFQIGSWKLFSYGALIAIGGAFSVRLWLSRWKEMGLERRDDVWLLLNVILFSGAIGGKVMFVLEYGPAWEGSRGFSVMGAFVSVLAAVYFFARIKKVPFRPLLDHVCLAAPLWHAFGRLGCFAAGCCYGRPTEAPWGVVFRDPRSMVPENLLGVRVHPTQLYESAGDLLIFALMWRRPRAGVYFIGYGVLRFINEFFRGDTVGGGLLTAGQWLSLGLVVLGTCFLY